MLTLTSDDRRLVADAVEAGPALVDRAVGWCAINSGSTHLDGLEVMAPPLIEALSRFPGTVERLPLADRATITAQGEVLTAPSMDALQLTVRPEAAVRILLTGHFDTVFPASSDFQTVVARADGALNGPGIADMKGGISVMLGALAAFEAHPAAAGVGYTVLLSPDEEIGSLGSAPLLAAAAATAHVGLTYEPAQADGTLVSARKGSGNYHLLIRGRAAHAGRDFAAGRNAVALAARLGAALDALNGRREGVTVNVAGIDGGGALNVVPDMAVLRFNVRVPDEGASLWFDAALRDVLADVPEGLSIDRHGGMTRPPKPFLGAQQRLFAFSREAGALIGQGIDWKPSGGVCEGNNLFAAGLPCIDTLGVRGGDIHSDREYAWPESFGERAALSALMMAKIADGSLDAQALRAQLGAEQQVLRG